MVSVVSVVSGMSGMSGEGGVCSLCVCVCVCVCVCERDTKLTLHSRLSGHLCYQLLELPICEYCGPVMGGGVGVGV